MLAKLKVKPKLPLYRHHRFLWQLRLFVLSILFTPVIATAYLALQYDICRPLWLRMFRYKGEKAFKGCERIWQAV